MAEKSIKIFLVEDDSIIRGLYEQAFRLMGYKIEAAVDGQDAVEKLEYMKLGGILPDIILLDIMMPRMNGFDVLHHLKLDEKLKGISVVVLTSVEDKEAVENALKSGAVAYLIKSQYEPKQIVEKVKEILTASNRMPL